MSAKRLYSRHTHQLVTYYSHHWFYVSRKKLMPLQSYERHIWLLLSRRPLSIGWSEYTDEYLCDERTGHITDGMTLHASIAHT